MKRWKDDVISLGGAQWSCSLGPDRNIAIPQAEALGKYPAEGLRVSAAGGDCSQQPHSVGEARCLLSTQAMMSLDSTGALPSFLPPLSPPLLFTKTFQTAD